MTNLSYLRVSIYNFRLFFKLISLAYLLISLACFIFVLMNLYKYNAARYINAVEIRVCTRKHNGNLKTSLLFWLFTAICLLILIFKVITVMRVNTGFFIIFYNFMNKSFHFVWLNM